MQAKHPPNQGVGVGLDYCPGGMGQLPARPSQEGSHRRDEGGQYLSQGGLMQNKEQHFQNGFLHPLPDQDNDQNSHYDGQGSLI